jgi:hypothetical protein
MTLGSGLWYTGSSRTPYRTKVVFVALDLRSVPITCTSPQSVAAVGSLPRGSCSCAELSHLDDSCTRRYSSLTTRHICVGQGTRLKPVVNSRALASSANAAL